MRLKVNNILKKRLLSLYSQLRANMRGQWNRVLPLGELLVNRWEKAKFCGFGADTSIYDSSIVMGDVKVGNNVWIGPFTLLDGSGATLLVGNNCTISSGVQIYTHDTVDNCVSGGLCETKKAPVNIGDNSYIGPMSIIGKGVALGKHCIVGANSFVNKSYPDYAIIAGTPARQIGYVVIEADGKVNRIYTDSSNE